MSLFLRQIARFVAQKAAANPHVREKAAEAAQIAIEEARQIAREEDRAYAAGKAVRRALDRFQGKG